MSTIPIPQGISQSWLTPERRHRIRILAAVIVLMTLIAGMFIYGLDYYLLGTHDRLLSAKHAELKPSGTLGLKMGILGVFLFLCLYMYPLRKKWRWLQRFGKTKNWLDFHVLLGITAPLVITLHSSFKLQGLAGVAYWLMIIVMLSGFAGRYIYAQIPRSLNASILSLKEMQTLCVMTAMEIEKLKIFSPTEIAALTEMTTKDIEHMSLARALCHMVWIDIQRPFRIAALRRRLLKSSKPRPDLDRAIGLVRTEAWLTAKMTFFSRTNQVFQLWHVVHRPFSYSFAVLAIVHIAVGILIGYF